MTDDDDLPVPFDMTTSYVIKPVVPINGVAVLPPWPVSECPAK